MFEIVLPCPEKLDGIRVSLYLIQNRSRGIRYFERPRRRFPRIQNRSEVSSRVRTRMIGDRLRSSADDNLSSPRAGLGSEVDDVVRTLDDVEIVLDDDDRISGLDESLEYLKQHSRVVEVQSRRRFVEDENGSPAVLPFLNRRGEKVPDELEALAFPA